MQNNNIYILGIPTSESLVTDELLSFINDETPTILLFNSPSAKEVNGYNFITSKKLVTVPIEGVEVALQDTHIVCCSLGKNIYLSDDGKNQTVDQIKDNFFNRINAIKQLYPNIRIAYCVFKSPYAGDNWLHKVITDSKEYSITVIDCKLYEDNDLNNFAKFIKIIKLASLNYLFDAPEPLIIRDKSGIFFNNNNPTFISNTYTDKTFEQIVDETALTYAGKNPLVAWSGGIDSTTILAAFIKNNIDFKVTFNDRVLIENKEVYDFIKDKYEIINIPNTLDLSSLDTDSLIVTGEGCDELHPRIQHDFVPGAMTLTEILLTQNIKDYDDVLLAPVDPIHLYNNVKEVVKTRYMNKFQVSEAEAEYFYTSYLAPKLDSMPIKIEHFYQLSFLIKLMFGFDHNVKDTSIDKYYKDVVSFYDTEDFQRWAITNLDANFEEFGASYLTMKQPNKNYNYAVFNMPSLLNQIKMHSTYRNFKTKELILPKSITYYQ
jgi:hypothetical protein